MNENELANGDLFFSYQVLSKKKNERIKYVREKCLTICCGL